MFFICIFLSFLTNTILKLLLSDLCAIVVERGWVGVFDREKRENAVNLPAICRQSMAGVAVGEGSRGEIFYLLPVTFLGGPCYSRLLI